LFVVGDSHSGPLNGLLLRDPANGEPLVFGESWCVQGLSARTALDPAGAPHPAVIAALAGFHLLKSLPYDYAGELPAVTLGDRQFTASWIAETTAVLFIAGELDAREIVASIPAGAEPVLPFPADLSALPAGGGGPALPASLLQARIVTTFRPLFVMLQELKRLGLARVALANLPPPTTSDEEYLRLTGIMCPARTRYSVHLFVNAMLRIFCTQSNMLFVDTWADVTDDNVAKPGIFVDGLHFGSEGARTVLAAFHAAAREEARSA